MNGNMGMWPADADVEFWGSEAPEAPTLPAPHALVDVLRDQLAEHVGLVQDTLQVLFERRESDFLAELANVREHSRDLHAALSAQRADQQFTREMVEQCLQNAITQRDRELSAAVAELLDRQAAVQQSIHAELQEHLSEWRAEVAELHRRLDAAIANETAQREAALALLREQLGVLREYQHDRDLRTEAQLGELLARTEGAVGGGASLGEKLGETLLRIRGR